MNKIIIACDFNSRQQLMTFLDKFPPKPLFLKLGMELIYGIGFEIINELKKAGHQIFLDLKLHDIPITIHKALIALNQYQVDFLTIHLTSGRQALEKAQEISKSTGTKLLGVTVLTSLDDEDLQEIFGCQTLTSEQLVMNLASLAVEYDFYGVICSPHEVQMIKRTYHQLKTITPGIQMRGQETDQKRTTTVKATQQLGADYLVVGRAITLADNPYQVYQEMTAQFLEKERVENE
ncbi:orotidine-5'-phosphate decarboxylase [Spiroplasma chrysopicola]|uniref:Orotidine 5'-phosphate decarboxylase n=1 Tax=Spiroplasma chrysopicola DF-1 TaxID=1276227 RepID=R4UAA3_9MOLU|nr:orotidine-5'-phosphate decarboxylase [Spiroplasma chrysopicola]AGM24834.1 orotidine-5'-phosphate decarboxylase [Spiroplasma chrysopicola DF-1]